MDGKAKNLYPLAEVDYLAKALPFPRTICRATHYSGTGKADRSLSDRYGSDNSRYYGFGRR